jgi:formylglycine-generating enzyme required for sulfatase activity
MGRWFSFLIALAGCTFAQDRSLIQIESANKLALVIGNSEYPKAPLKNPVNDAASMETALKKLGFKVTLVRNADLRHLREAIDEFAAKLGPGSLGLFYFAGHGVQVNSVNYLVPVDFAATSEDDVQYEAYPASRIQAKLEGSGARLRVIILDACRNNPFRYKRDASEGLAAMSINAEGTLIAFATGDNNTAAENPAETNGLYTKFLIPALMTPGLNLREAFQKAKEDVYRASQRQQNPSVYENIVGQYALIPGVSTGVPTAPPVAISSPPVTTTPRSTDPSHSEAAAEKTWAMIKDSHAPRDFDNFVETFPKSTLAPQALLRAMELRAEKSKPAAATQPLAAVDSSTQLKASLNPGQGRTPARAPVNTPPPVPGASKTNPKDGLIYVWIPPGSFMMGCSPNDGLCFPNEKPAHHVTISKGFWMGQTPVTNLAWNKFPHPSGWAERTVTYAGKSFKLTETTKLPNVPAVGMLWDEARVFCEKVDARLPTEAEWEYAARAGNPAARYARLAAISASTDENGRELSLPGPPRVAQKEKNAWNLYDMIGNVWQWTADRHAEDYYERKVDLDPPGPTTGIGHVVRGGSFARNATAALRASHRSSFTSNRFGYDIGFRCVLE